MASMLHPKTGERVRVETVCAGNPPDFDHDYETVTNTWAEYVAKCRACGIMIGGHL